MMADPYTGFRFLVTLDNADAYLPPSQAALLPEIASGEFREAKGLGADLEVMPYPEGGVNDYVHQLPVRHSWSRISLTRGVVKDSILWNWYQAGLTQSLGARRDGAIILLSPEGKTAMTWEFRAGLAAKYVGPNMDAMADEVAVESLEIAHEGLNLVVSGGTIDVGEIIDTVGGFFS